MKKSPLCAPLPRQPVPTVFLLMTSDPHSSEYLPAYYNSLPFFSGFTGENSTLIVTDRQRLWCDGQLLCSG